MMLLQLVAFRRAFLALCAAAVVLSQAHGADVRSKLPEFDLHPQAVLQGVLNSRAWEHEGVMVMQSGAVEMYAGMAPGRPPKSRLWSTVPVTAVDGIEVRLDFEMSSNKPDDPKVHGFALWYTQSRPDSSVATDLLGGPPTFKGVVAFFSTRARSGAIAASISGVANDGSQALTIREVPSQKGVYWNFPGQPLNFRLVIVNNEVVAQAKGVASDKWNDMFTLTGTNLYTPGGYIGITAMGDVESTAAAAESLRITSLAVYDVSAPPSNVPQHMPPHPPQQQQPQAVPPQHAAVPPSQVHQGPVAPPSVAAAAGGAAAPQQQDTALLMTILRRLDQIDMQQQRTSTALNALNERIAGVPHASERLLSTGVEVLNSHLNNFKKELEEHARLTQHLVTASHDEKQTVNRIHMEGIRAQVEKHTKVTWLVLALVVATVGFVAVVSIKNIYMPAKSHVF